VKRFGLPREALEYAKTIVADHHLSGVRISRLTSDARRLDVGEYPEGASDAYHATMLVESQSMNASNLSRLGYSPKLISSCPPAANTAGERLYAPWGRVFA
jgi:hypothetical protein